MHAGSEVDLADSTLRFGLRHLDQLPSPVRSMLERGQNDPCRTQLTAVCPVFSSTGGMRRVRVIQATDAEKADWRTERRRLAGSTPTERLRRVGNHSFRRAGSIRIEPQRRARPAVVLDDASSAHRARARAPARGRPQSSRRVFCPRARVVYSARFVCIGSTSRAQKSRFARDSSSPPAPISAGGAVSARRPRREVDHLHAEAAARRSSDGWSVVRSRRRSHPVAGVSIGRAGSTQVERRRGEGRAARAEGPLLKTAYPRRSSSTNSAGD